MNHDHNYTAILYRYVRDNPGKSGSVIREHMRARGWDEKTIGNIMRHAKRYGYIENRGGQNVPGSGRPASWHAGENKPWGVE